MFSNCSNFSITGGTFINTIERDATPDYRSISVGDINLLSSVGDMAIVEDRRMVQHKKPSQRVRSVRVVTGKRSVYHARIFGNQDTFTVVAYESSLPRNVVESQGTRHPNVAQLFGLTTHRTMTALVYHDMLIPVDAALDKCSSSLSRKMLNYTLWEGFDSFQRHWSKMHNSGISSLPFSEWFRPSTGQLCVEIGQESEAHIAAWWHPSHTHIPVVLSPSGSCLSDEEIFASINVSQMLEVLSYQPTMYWHVPLVSADFTLGAGYTTGVHRYEATCISRITNTSQITEVPPPPQLLVSLYPNRRFISFPIGTATNLRGFGSHTADLDAGGWCRFDLTTLRDEGHYCDGALAYHFLRHVTLDDDLDIHKAWLSQAIDFRRKYPDLENYLLVDGIQFEVTVWYPTDPFTLCGTFMANQEQPPQERLYLFLFPHQYSISPEGIFSVNIPSSTEGSAYYFSFSPDGNPPVTREALNEHDIIVPEVYITTSLRSRSYYWNDDTLDILSQFCIAKGLDPAAPLLGYPRGILASDAERVVPISDQDISGVKDFPPPKAQPSTLYCDFCEHVYDLQQNLKCHWARSVV
ncbi:hypothetical protein C8F01DRAFT_677944 [Mycena amicta]|nr:hypothetical protein C8F01DRAFT_677944 [Mycena amicta]